MNFNWLERTNLLIKQHGIQKLQNAHILVVGLGGVGAFACEFLARAGVGKLTIVDGDNVDLTNKNRQLVALDSTIGKPKAQIMAQRIQDINPEIKLRVITKFLEPNDAYDLISKEYDYVADCIDSISPKLNLIKACRDKKVKLISSMGAGGVLDPSLVKVGNIDKTRDCPLARHIRKRMKQENICFKFKAVFSLELPDKDSVQHTDGTNYKRSYYGTMSYMPAVFGIHIAATIIKNLLNKE